jgi:hypothetical protein
LPEPSLKINGSATPEEAAAIAVAIDLFAAETVPALKAAAPVVSPWFHAGLLEATGNDLDTVPFTHRAS